jgi:hypothetical protein
MKTPPAKSKAGGNQRSKPPSPVYTRKVNDLVRVMLFVRAGGRCEFAGCNKYLLEHSITLTEGNFAEMAHVVAFQKGGPRGGVPQRPANINELSNLMLLCAECHKLIDDNPSQFSVAMLETYKADHEDRIKQVTSTGPDLRTVVVQMKARIGGQAVEIPLTDVSAAVAPRWPMDRQGHVIDLSGIADDQPSFYELAAAEIRRKVERLYESGMAADKVRHLSLFALAPIPLLVYLGSRLSNKIPVDFYQRHRDSNNWLWKTDGVPAEYEIRRLRTGTDVSSVAAILSLSGSISMERLPQHVDATFSVYELTLTGRSPGTDFLRRREDLRQFCGAYRDLLAEIVRDRPRASTIHLFPAVPAPVAVACGHEVLPKAQPRLAIYDFTSTRDGFIFRLSTGDDAASAGPTA